MENDDFGFSLVSEQELKAHETLLRKKVEEQSVVVQETTEELTKRINGLRDMIMPLLNNLAKDPTREYIFWPERASKISAFIDKLNKYVDG
jgi:alpha-N-acetylglucosamine transferase